MGVMGVMGVVGVIVVDLKESAYTQGTVEGLREGYIKKV